MLSLALFRLVLGMNLYFGTLVTLGLLPDSAIDPEMSRNLTGGGLSIEIPIPHWRFHNRLCGRGYPGEASHCGNRQMTSNNAIDSDMHPQLSMHFVEGPEGAPFHPSHLYWPVGEEGVVIRGFHLYPIVIDPRDSAVAFSGANKKIHKLGLVALDGSTSWLRLTYP